MVMVRHTLAVVADEISRDFVTAAEFAQRAGISRLELRNLRTGRFPFVEPEELAEIERYAAVHTISFATISPGLCKQELDPETDIGVLRERNRALLSGAIAGAHRIGARNIITFGFRRPKTRPGHARFPDWCIDFLRECAEEAHAAGLRLLIENHSSCYVATTDDLLDVCRRVDSPKLGVNWDPYNSWARDRDIADTDWAALAPRLGQVHVKDGRRRDGEIERTAIGRGDIAWRTILAAHAGNPEVGLVIETHRRPRMAHVSEDIEALTAMLAELEVATNG